MQKLMTNKRNQMEEPTLKIYIVGGIIFVDNILNLVIVLIVHLVNMLTILSIAHSEY